jgi:hypothetical protein
MIKESICLSTLSTDTATIHTTHEIASTVLIPLMSHDEEKMHPQVIVSGSPNQEI